MAQPTQAAPKTKAEKEAQQKAVRRAEQANILAGVRPILEENEQLLAFSRARIAGGWKSKLNVGPEAFFAPFVNVALTERRFLVQHVHHTTGRPSEMLPHAYTLDKIARVTFTDIETYGGEPACRLILHLENGLFVRLRLRGQLNFASARSMGELFDSLTTAKRKTALSPTKAICPRCDHVLDQPFKFCPFCGTQQPPRTSGTATEEAPTAAHEGITIAVPDETPLTEATVFVTPTNALTNVGEQGAADADVSTPAMSVPRETDFAYEREDRPAEFGFALPRPDDLALMEPETAEAGVTSADAPGDTNPSGVTINTEGAESASFEEAEADTGSDLDDLADDSLFAPTSDAAPAPGEPGQNTLATGGADSEQYSAEAEYETMFAPDEPSPAHDASDGGGVAFEQYDAQAFTELPFSDTPDEESDVPPGLEAGVQTDGIEPNTAEANTIEANTQVRDDVSEAFMPQSDTKNSDTANTENGENPA